ncbi:MAG TPA: bifunctional oligoribonuclease/PAP phosphatase NrnA [Patescibacteria group bacterium]
MNYPHSQEILDEVKKSEKVLINCHANCDADSVGSAVSFLHFVKGLGKEAKIVSPSPIPKNLSFLKETKDIEIVDYEKFDFTAWDLFVVLDSASWERVTGNKKVSIPSIPIIVIDHHETNEKFGKINMVDESSPSNCEILFWLFRGWGINMDANLSTSLLTGVMGDTGGLRFRETKESTFVVVADLMTKRADRETIILNLFQSYELLTIKFWVEVLNNLKIDEESGIAWSATKFEIYKKYERPVGAKSEIADLIFQSVSGSKIGIVMIGEDKRLDVSFRSRTGVDVSKIAAKLGGGGHRWAAAAKILDLPFEKAVEKVLDTAKELMKEKEGKI